MSDEVKESELTHLAESIRHRVQELGGERPPTAVLRVSLSDYFRYNVHKGGFAQLIFNLQGEYLPEIEEMLLDAPAPVAHTYYVKAIEVCLADQSSYHAFLASDYISSNSIKDALHGVTFEYYEKGVGFLSEINPFLRVQRSVVKDWLRSAKPG